MSLLCQYPPSPTTSLLFFHYPTTYYSVLHLSNNAIYKYCINFCQRPATSLVSSKKKNCAELAKSRNSLTAPFNPGKRANAGNMQAHSNAMKAAAKNQRNGKNHRYSSPWIHRGCKSYPFGNDKW